MRISFSKTVHHRFFTLLTTTGMAVLYTYFLYTHLKAVQLDIVSNYLLLFVAIESLIIALLVFRKKPVEKSIKPIGWIVAATGTFLPLLLNPNNTLLINPLVAEIFITTGAALALLAFLSLNTSYGTSPSLRTIKTNGMYKIVRHPIYFAYFFIYIGYILFAFSVYNLVLILCLFVLLLLRTIFEEEVLQHDPEYVAYQQKVQSKIIPFIY